MGTSEIFHVFLEWKKDIPWIHGIKPPYGHYMVTSSYAKICLDVRSGLNGFIIIVYFKQCETFCIIKVSYEKEGN